MGEGYTPDRQDSADRRLRELEHWYRDDLDLEWGCDCDACDWWKEQLRIHRETRARN